MKDDFGETNHRVSLKDRKSLSVSGVDDVDSFDEKMITALTSMGEMTIKGEGLKILSLNTQTGDLSVEGSNIYSVAYTGEKSDDSGFFKRLFK